MLSDLHAFEKFFRLSPSETSDDWVDPEEVKRIRFLGDEEEGILRAIYED